MRSIDSSVNFEMGGLQPVGFGREADPGQLNLSVCFLQKETLKTAA